MPYSFTSAINPFVISSLYESVKATRPSSRLPNTAYSTGTQVVNNNNRYVCIQNGVTGGGAGPTGSTGTFFDGSVRWLALGPDSVQDGSIISNLYVGVGRQTPWANEASPPTPDVSYSGQQAALDDATAFIRIDASNVRLGIQNNTWQSGTVYEQYDPTVNQYTNPHYAIIGSTYVYKCIDNNNGAASVAAPSGGLSGSFIETADGYIWKYVGEITTSEQFDFATTQFVPAPTGISPDQYVQGEISTFKNLQSVGDSYDEGDTIAVTVVGDGAGANAAVRTLAAGGSKDITSIFATSGGSGYTEAYAIAWDAAAEGTGAQVNVVLDGGEVDAITVTDAGSDYDDAVVLIIGDGTGAAATANVVGGQIASISIDDAGQDYTWARAFVVPGVRGSIAEAVFSPVNGHGSNIATELGVRSLLISTKLSPSLNNYIPTEPMTADGSFRQVTLVSGVEGTTRNATAYIGKSHPSYNSAGNLNKYKDGSGYVVYINNITPITHTSSQEEIIKISISL